MQVAETFRLFTQDEYFFVNKLQGDYGICYW